MPQGTIHYNLQPLSPTYNSYDHWQQNKNTIWPKKYHKGPLGTTRDRQKVTGDNKGLFTTTYNHFHLLTTLTITYNKIKTLSRKKHEKGPLGTIRDPQWVTRDNKGVFTTTYDQFCPRTPTYDQYNNKKLASLKNTTRDHFHLKSRKIKDSTETEKTKIKKAS